MKISENGKHLRFNIVDGFLYFNESQKGVRYNFNSNKTETTTHIRTHEYSPNGRYYVYSAGMDFDAPYWSPFRIFDLVKSDDLSPDEIGFVSERNPTAFFWSRDSQKLVFEGRSSRADVTKMIFVYDIISSQLIKKTAGKIAGYNNGRNEVVIYLNGDLYAEKIPVSRGQQ